MSYALRQIFPRDTRAMDQLDALLHQEDIRRDPNLDYMAGLYDDTDSLVATGSLFGNTLRCLAVDSRHQGEGLMAQIVSHLVDYQFRRELFHLFIYTKPGKSGIFENLGFHTIAQVGDDVQFMENRRTGFEDYISDLAAQRQSGTGAALVMNCNPFTLGHLHLVEQAAAQNDTVHLFVVSEDLSFFPFRDRFRLVQEGCAHLPGVRLHQTGSYMISSAVFPSYFLRDDTPAITVQARLDLQLFTRIAAALGVTRRYVGEEPFSQVTGIYNQIMQEALPAAGIECVVIPRKEQGSRPISASYVRQLIHDGPIEAICDLVPPTTFEYFSTPQGQAVAEKIRKSHQVIHY